MGEKVLLSIDNYTQAQPGQELSQSRLERTILVPLHLGDIWPFLLSGHNLLSQKMFSRSLESPYQKLRLFFCCKISTILGGGKPHGMS